MNKRTNEETLRLSIERAIENGWDLFGFSIWSGRSVMEAEFPYQTWVWVSDGRPGIYPGKFSLNDIIFSHGFAQSFWGEGEPNAHLPEWMYHLQQMVIEPNPLDYIERFLDREEVSTQ